MKDAMFAGEKPRSLGSLGCRNLFTCDVPKGVESWIQGFTGVLAQTCIGGTQYLNGFL